MNLILTKLIDNSKNILFVTNKLEYVNSINLDYNIFYISLCENYLYFKKDSNFCKPDHECNGRLIIDDPYNPVIDKNFNSCNGIASHNMYFFKDKYNVCKAIGGQHYGKISSYDYLKNKKYDEYHKNNSFIKYPSRNVMYGYDYVYNSNIQCPYYANGLHLFGLENDKLVVLNDGFPIISGVNSGGYDGHYEYTDNINIENSRNGLTVYDSLGSVLYNKKQNLYFLYHRANIGNGVRSIQYTTSVDLKNWSKYNMVKFGKNFNYFSTNMYYSNFFSIPNTNMFLGIIPFVKIHNKNVEYYQLYYSVDCINYNYVGDMLSKNINFLENFNISTNHPYIYKDKMFFYLSETDKNKLHIYTINLNRFCYITNESDKESVTELKTMTFHDNKIEINVETVENGYISMEIIGEEHKYSFEHFDTIHNVNEVNYVAKWNGSYNLPSNILKLKIKLYKSKLFAINGEECE